MEKKEHARETNTVVEIWKRKNMQEKQTRLMKHGKEKKIFKKKKKGNSRSPYGEAAFFSALRVPGSFS